MVNRPVRAKGRRIRAWPLPSSVTRATSFLPTRNVTVPLGVPDPGATAATVAVNVTARPVTPGLADDPRAAAVAARLTLTAAVAELLPVKPALPAKEAVSAWLPTPSDTARMA